VCADGTLIHSSLISGGASTAPPHSIAISAKCDRLVVQAHAAEAALQAGSVNLGIFPFALSVTPRSSPLVNSTPGVHQRLLDEGRLIRRDGRLSSDTLGALDYQ
jgi:hypothetical protein